MMMQSYMQTLIQDHQIDARKILIIEDNARGPLNNSSDLKGSPRSERRSQIFDTVRAAYCFEEKDTFLQSSRLQDRGGEKDKSLVPTAASPANLK
eukprot:scaffold11555_cov111-Cylindrotheca_fusiformis.AAC.3